MSPDDLNRACCDFLIRKGVKEGEFVVVVGAGVSIPMIPSGSGLRSEMAAICGIIDDEIEPYWDFFQRARTESPKDFRETIIKTFCEPPEWHSEACSQIVRLPCKSIITLNYDDHLQDAFSLKFGSGWQERFAVYPIQPGKGFAWPAEFAHKFHLLAAHGYRVRDFDAEEPDLSASWPDDGIILTRSQFEEHYFGDIRGHHLFHWWEQVFCRFSCLFIGTSLQEPGIEAVITQLLNDKNPDFLKNKRIQLQNVSPGRVDSPTGVQRIYPNPKPPLESVQQVQYDPKQGFRGLLEILSVLTEVPLRGPLESAKRAPSPPPSFNIT